MILFVAGMLFGIAIAYAAFRYWKRVLKTRLSLMSLLIPPDDLYENLFEVKLPPTGDQVSIEVVYSHRYAGYYEIGLVCEKDIGFPIKTLVQIQVRTRWKYPDGRIIADRNETIILNISWDGGPERNGFRLFLYDISPLASKDRPKPVSLILSEFIPVDERISLEITINNCNEVVENYGALGVYGRRLSCK
ncbi:MAG: hypothetical protein LBS49_03100 [Candidatus Accumulibacter sp.]|nr:hypothetical protein [Accumulibacter sp.]